MPWQNVPFDFKPYLSTEKPDKTVRPELPFRSRVKRGEVCQASVLVEHKPKVKEVLCES